MREKIIGIPIKVHGYDGKTYLTFDSIDEILKEICEEIEKVENPYGYWGKIKLEHWEKGQQDGFEFCRQKILDLLRSIENPVGSADL